MGIIGFEKKELILEFQFLHYTRNPEKTIICVMKCIEDPDIRKEIEVAICDLLDTVK